MCRKVTTRAAIPPIVLWVVCWSAAAQSPTLEWRHVGNSAIDLALPSVATGPVDRVWYSPDGTHLYARTSSGRVFETEDFEQWRLASETPVPARQESPEVAAANGRLYSIRGSAYRSDDGGLSWANLTDYKGSSILGGQLSDLAVSPKDADELVVASASGIWRSVDGGLSWSGLNQFLPNLPPGKFVAVPRGPQGVRLALNTPDLSEVEWAPGEKTAWKRIENVDSMRQLSLKSAFSQILKRPVTALATAGSMVYTGDSEGRLSATSDQGNSWARFNVADSAPVEAIWVDAKDPRIAVAVARGVFRTMNGGLFWDDITANLSESATGAVRNANGVVADRGSGAIYVATDSGVFYTTTDLSSAGRPTPWTPVSEGLPRTAAMDVALDAGGNQLYVSLEGYGVYATMAPHRFRDARVANAADYSSRPAAPGSLLSVLGMRVQTARTGNGIAPVLAASDTASQIQVPFEAKGSTVSMTLEAASGRLSIGLPLQNVSPAIFVDPDGAPLILDADNGMMLDASKPAHSNARIQVLATGLGRVTPDWPTGLPGRLNDPPKVIAPVSAYLDRSRLEVTRAVLAPYIGYYLIEIQLPQIVNAGPAEFYIEADGQQSNRVRLYLDP